MRIAVFGLGYVGCVTAACLAREGHDVTGVDVNTLKVEMINSARSPIVENRLDTLLEEVSEGKGGRLRATTDAAEAIADAEVSLICVGTPSEENGNLDLSHVRACAGQIGAALKDLPGYHVVIARSTMLPGSVEEVVIRTIEQTSDKSVGSDFGVVMNPEFLRESTAVQDFYEPPVTVIGAYDQRSGDTAARIFEFLDAPSVRTDLRTAEMIKYANNCFHALKVTFANEIGSLCRALDIDSHPVMDVLCMDRKLNLSPYYLKPGFAFGGSCLPKDLRAITYKAKQIDVELPVLGSLLESNRLHVERAVKQITRWNKKRIGILGLSFKAGTDDLRESPLVSLAESLIGKGYDLRIYDENVALARLMGANKDYIETQIPHISSLMSDDRDSVIDHAEVVVIGNRGPEFAEALESAGADKIVYDLVRIVEDPPRSRDGYTGICW